MNASRAAERAPDLESPPVHRRALRIAAWIAILASGIVIRRALPTAELFALVERSVRDLGPWAPIVFALLYFLAAVLFMPGSALTIAAGAIFGLLGGVAIVSVASTAAAGASFPIARHAARARVQRLAQSNRTFGAIDAAIGEGGWRVVALLRLSPAVPFSLGNYLYGLTPSPIGCELAQSFARFGASVTVVDIAKTILPREDPDAALFVVEAMGRDGVAFDARNGVEVDDFLRTTNPRVYAAGDVSSRFRFTHAADAQARIVIRNALFFGRAKASRLVMP